MKIWNSTFDCFSPVLLSFSWMYETISLTVFMLYVLLLFPWKYGAISSTLSFYPSLLLMNALSLCCNSCLPMKIRNYVVDVFSSILLSFSRMYWTISLTVFMLYFSSSLENTELYPRRCLPCPSLLLKNVLNYLFDCLYAVLLATPSHENSEHYQRLYLFYPSLLLSVLSLCCTSCLPMKIRSYILDFISSILLSF